MRLYKPKLHVSLPVPCAPSELLGGIGSLDLGGSDSGTGTAMPSHFRDTPFALSNFFILPDNFGDIFLGETFCSYISVLNQHAHNLSNVGLTAQLQTPNGRADLRDVREQRGEAVPQNPAVVFAPAASLDMVVEHALRDLGVHTLRVGVTYTSRATGEQKSLRKLYRFNVTSPLSMTFRHMTVQGISCVEAQLRNTTRAQMMLDAVTFLASPQFVAENVGGEFEAALSSASGVASADDAASTVTERGGETGNGAVPCWYLKPDQVLQLIHRITVKPGCADAAQAATDLGRLEIRWKTAMGEPGCILSQPVVRKLPTTKEVQLEVRGAPAELELGEPFLATCVVTNRTARPMSLQLQFRRDLMVGVFVSDLAFQNLGEVGANASKECTVELLPLVAGMHELKGVMVEDLRTNKKYTQERLLDMYVVNSKLGVPCKELSQELQSIGSITQGQPGGDFTPVAGVEVTDKDGDDQQVYTKDEVDPARPATEHYRCLGMVMIRSAPAMDAAKPDGEPVVREKDVVEISTKLAVGEQTFLKLADGRGWVIMTKKQWGVSGKVEDRSMFEKTAYAPSSGAYPPAGTLKKAPSAASSS